MNIIDIAIIDSKVNDVFSDEIYKRIVMSNEKITHSLHGTICYLILKKYSDSSRISNFEILSTKDIGNVDDLEIALDWCEKENISLANLSFGSIHFMDKEKIQEIVNKYANKGIIFVVAVSNKFFSSYPSKFSSVIGVANDYPIIKQNNITAIDHIGIDVFASSEHEIDICGNIMTTEICNSFAAPYISSVVGNLLLGNKTLTIKEIKQILSPTHYKDPYIPDWISNAYTYGTKPRTKATPYFKEVLNIDEADTIILYDEVNNIDSIKFKDKHCVNLTRRTIDKYDKRFFYWCYKNRKNQINNALSTKCNFNIPIINITISYLEDVIYFSLEMKKLFANDGYNAYIASTNVDCILYNLEFIPKKFLMHKNKYIKAFFYWETYYNQADILIITNDININKDLLDIDINISIEMVNGQYSVKVDGNNKYENLDLVFDNLNLDTIKQVYESLLLILS